MKFKLLTIFPDMLKAVLRESILGRAIRSGIIQAEVIDIRPFSQSKHKNTDDTPYGGGAGMVMSAQCCIDAMRFAMGEDFRGKRIYLSPKGAKFTQKMAEKLAGEDELILLAGHYEGIDQRVIDSVIDEEISVGDYVLTGGELGALIITDAVARLIPGVLGDFESSVDESFSSGLLEYPHYTRPREYEGMTVPEVLLNGNQKQIDRWRRDEALKITLQRRPELLKSTLLDGADREKLRKCKPQESLPLRVLCARGALKADIEARLHEAAQGLIDFDKPQNLLVWDRDFVLSANTLPVSPTRALIPRLPTAEEKVWAQANNVRLFGFTPRAFDSRFREVINDDSIEELVFSGLEAEEFVCLASLWLPIRKIDERGLFFAKSRRAICKKGTFPGCAYKTRAGERFSFSFCAPSEAYLRAALDFFKSDKPPLARKALENAENALQCYDPRCGNK